MSSVIIEELGPITIRALLRPLLQMCGFAVALGMVYLVDAIVRALFGTVSGAVGWIPYAGKVISSPVHGIEKKLTGALGRAESSLDNSMGAAFHGLADLVKRLAADVQAAAVFDWHLAQRLIHRTNPAYLYHSLQHAFAKVRDIPAHAAAAITAALHPLMARFHALDQWTHARVKALEHSIGVAIPNDIAGLRARTRAIENGYEAVWKKIRHFDAVLATEAFAGAVAVALAGMGLGFLRCNSFRNIGNKLGCTGFGLLETLLSDAIEAFIVADLCDFVYGMSLVAEEFSPVLLAFVDVEDVLIGCRGATRPPALSLPPLDLPPVLAPLSLAA